MGLAVSELSDELARVFEARELMWKIGGVRKVPTSEDIQAVLDRGLTEASHQDSGEENEAVNIVMTHLIFRREAGVTKVYLDMGEL